jgi:hypothetical protein
VNLNTRRIVLRRHPPFHSSAARPVSPPASATAAVLFDCPSFSSVTGVPTGRGGRIQQTTSKDVHIQVAP